MNTNIPNGKYIDNDGAHSWFEDACIYHSYPLGMLGALDADRDPHVNRLAQLTGWIPYLQESGFDTLLLGPVLESEYHGYDTVDFLQIDRRLGSREDMIWAAGQFASSGIRLMFDGVFNHVGKGFFAFQDVIARGEASPYLDWFYIDLSKPNGYEPFSYRCWEGHPELVELNLGNRGLREYLFSAVRGWIDDFGISGLRLDVAYCLDKDFMRELRAVCRSCREDFILLGEVIHGDYRTYDMLDSVTNYQCYKALYSSHNDLNCFEIAYELGRQFGSEGISKGRPLYNFVDNHDVDRVASLLHEKKHLHTLYLLLMTMPGVPSVYYGSEKGMTGKRTGTSDRGLRPRLSPGFEGDDALASFIGQLIDIRGSDPALRYGDYRQAVLSNGYFGFCRGYGDEETVVLINMTGEPVHIQLSGVHDRRFFTDRLAGGERIYIENGVSWVSIPPCGGRILTSV